MRYLYYYYNYQAMLFLRYKDDYQRFEERYMGYSLRGAIRKFRQDHNLVGKHIKVQKLY